MNIHYSSQRYGMISHDITNHCNARCRFCLNDWSDKAPFFMTLETFKKSRAILPLCSDRKFHLSCLYEPTLNPHFFEILDAIPLQYKSRVFFTTNLLRKMTDEELAYLCSAHVCYFNISLETYQKKRYEYLTATKNSYFFDNLHRLSSIAKQTNTNKKIRVITMILRSNYDELIDIIQRVQDEISPEKHELRTPYISSTIERVLQNELLTRKELDTLYDKIQKLGYQHLILDVTRDIDMLSSHLKSKKTCSEDSEGSQKQCPADNIHQVCIDSLGIESIDSPSASSKSTVRDFLYKVRINANGTGYFMDTNKVFDLNTIEDPFMFFSRQLLQLQRDEAQQYIISSPTTFDIMEYPSNCILASLDDITVTDGIILSLRGWFLDALHLFHEQKRVIFLSDADFQGGILLCTKTLLYSGISEAEEDPSPCGFLSKIAVKHLDSNMSYTLFVGFLKGHKLHLTRLGSLPPVSKIIQMSVTN